MKTLEQKQAEMLSRHEKNKKLKPGPVARVDDHDQPDEWERCRRRVVAYLMHQRGVDAVTIAERCNLVFKTRWNGAHVEGWIQRGCPLM